MASSTNKDVKQPETTVEPALRKSFLSGSLIGWTLDVPPHLHKASLIIGPVYVAFAPVVYRLTRPHGHFSALLDSVYGPRDAKAIVALVALAALNAYVITAGGSIYAQSTHPRGYQNSTPRLVKTELRGFAHRLTAAHQSLIEVFPGFGITAALVYSSLVTKSTSNTSLVDGLFLHFILKNILFYVAYLADSDLNRSVAHIISIGALLSVLYELHQSL